MWKFIETVRLDFPNDYRAEITLGSRKWSLTPMSANVITQIKKLRKGLESLENVPVKLLTLLRDEGLIYKIQTFEFNQFERTLQWLSYFHENAEEKFTQLQGKRVAIFGCGGTGAVISDHLARSGIKYFTLVDGAKVDLPDLNRQFTYRTSDIGIEKTMALKRSLNDIDPNIEVNCIQKFIDSQDDVERVLQEEKFDLVICCMDQPQYKIQSYIAAAAANLELPFAFGAVGVLDAVIGPVHLNRNELRQVAEKFQLAAQHYEKTQPIRGSIAFTNTIAAAHLGFACYRYLLGQVPTPQKLKTLDFS